jgi:recombinational DNA repair protein (RecF pathway)
MGGKVDPDAAVDLMRKAGAEPLVPYPGSQPQWSCRCLTCGRTIAPRYTNVRRGCAPCVSCARIMDGARRRSKGEAAAYALAAERQIEPLESYHGVTRPWRCKCMRCGSETSPTIHDLKSGQGACRTCAFAAQSVRQLGPESLAISDMRAANLEPLEPFPGLSSLGVAAV